MAEDWLSFAFEIIPVVYELMFFIRIQSETLMVIAVLSLIGLYQCRENAVTSCLKCNGKKGSLTLPQLRSIGMKLCREPFVPTQYELAARASRMVPRKVHPVWAPYLGLPPKVVSSSNGGGDAKHSSKYRGKDEEWYFEDAL